MPKKPQNEVLRELLRGADMPRHENLEEIVRHPWAGGVHFDQPPTEAERAILAKAGFEYDGRLGMAWRNRGLPGEPDREPEDRDRE